MRREAPSQIHSHPGPSLEGVKQRDPGLEALRALAALLVLFAHGGYFLYAALPHYDTFALAAWLGTDAFFALSGFLVARHLLSEPPRHVGEAARYALWRAWRILPLFWLALLLHLALAHLGGRPVPDSLLSYVTLTQNLAAPQSAFFGEAWSLPLLMLMSIAAPGMAMSVRQLGGGARAFAALFALLLLVGIALRLAWIQAFDPTWDEGVRKVLATRLDACAYGALAACLIWARHPLMASRGRNLVFAALALGVAGTGFLLLPRDSSDLARAGLFVASGLGAALACAGVAGVERKSSPLLRWLAQISFALYLVNMPVLFALELAGLGQSADALQGAGRFVLWLAATLMVAAALHHFVERPLLAWRNRVLSAATSATNR